MRYYVTINGVSSLTIPGLAIRQLPSISKTLMRNQKETIDGRDGDIITELGYSAYDKTLEIGLFGTYDINQIIAFFNQKGTIVFSDESDKYYNFTILDQIDYDRLVKFRTASVRIHCQPFKYQVGETPVVVQPESVSGEGTNITLDNTGVAALGISLKGDTYQYSTTGKNLCNPQGHLAVFGGSYITASSTLITSPYTTQINYRGVSFIAKVEANKTYVISSDISLTGKYAVGIYNSEADVSTSSNIVEYIGGVTSTFTPTHSGYAVIGKAANDSGTTITWSWVQVEEGSTPTTYEPYTAGASPNPTYPQDIEVVTGGQNILVRNKNLFDSWQIGKKINATTGVISDDSNSAISGYIPVNFTTNPNYYVSGLTDTLNSFVGAYNSNKQFLGRTGGTAVSNWSLTSSSFASGTPQGTGNIAYLIVTQYKSTGNTGNISDVESLQIQIEKGNSASSYVAPLSQNYEINLGKNLFKGLLSQFDNIGGTGSTYTYFKLDSNKTYTLSATAKNDITVASNKYLGLTNQGGSTTGGYNWLIKQGDTFTQGQKVSLNSSASRNYVSMYATDQTTLTYLLDNFDIQLEVGTEATSYSPYKTPIELCKIGTYQDYIYKSGADWKIHREIGKVVLTGSADESWSTWDIANVDTQRFVIVLTGKNFGHSVCNRFYYSQSNGDFEHYRYSTSQGENNNFVILINRDRLDTVNVAGLKTWLGNNNLIVYARLYTPTDETITDTELIEDLETLWTAYSYIDQTNITSSGSLPIYMRAVTLKKGTNEAVINNVGNIYAKPIIAIQGTGTIGLYLDNTQMLSIDMSAKHYITIDTEKMEAYNTNDQSELLNRKVTGDYSKLKLQPGNNTLKFTFETQMQKATITNWKRWL